jgi:hypothetical protein
MAAHDLWAHPAGSGTAAGFIDHPAVASGEQTEPAVAHDLPQNGRGRRDALQPNLGHRDCERVIWIG